MAKGEVIEGVSPADSLTADWDALADASGRPLAAPGWLMAWWRHLAPSGSRLRIVTVRDGRDLVGLAPFFAERSPTGLTQYRLMGTGISVGAEPLARSGLEPLVAHVVAATLQRARPRPDTVSLDGITDPVWVRLLRQQWPSRRRPRAVRREAGLVPTVSLTGPGYENWFESRSANFRQQMRRDRRGLEGAGATFRLTAVAEDLKPDMADFARLHRSRWGPDRAISDRVVDMLMEAGEQLLPGLRFRLWSVAVDGRAISSHILLAAGGEVSYWLGAIDEGWARYRPGLQGLLPAIEHAWTIGDRRLDLGPGDEHYKRRLADTSRGVEWWDVVPSGIRMPRTPAQLVPWPMRQALSARLSPVAKNRLRRAFGRANPG